MCLYPSNLTGFPFILTAEQISLAPADHPNFFVFNRASASVLDHCLTELHCVSVLVPKVNVFFLNIICSIAGIN